MRFPGRKNEFTLSTFLSPPQEGCNEVIYNSDSPFKRLDHYKLHEYTKKWNPALSSGTPTNNNSKSSSVAAVDTTSTSSSGTSPRPPSPGSGPIEMPSNKETVSMTLSTSLDAMFKRKRGRPPKNRVVEVSLEGMRKISSWEYFWAKKMG